MWRESLTHVAAIRGRDRRGEILALRWSDLNTDRAVLKAARSVEETKSGIAIKEPKYRSGRREVAMPQVALDALEEHRAKQENLRDVLAAEYQDNGLICCVEDGAMWKPCLHSPAPTARS